MLVGLVILGQGRDIVVWGMDSWGLIRCIEQQLKKCVKSNVAGHGNHTADVEIVGQKVFDFAESFWGLKLSMIIFI